jgi:hypothetical protein
MHRKVMLSHEADLRIDNVSITRVAILHCEAIRMIHIYLFKN